MKFLSIFRRNQVEDMTRDEDRVQYENLVPRILELQKSALPADIKIMFKRIISEFIPERDELTAILQNQSIKVLPHIKERYWGRIGEVDNILKAASRVALALEKGFVPISLDGDERFRQSFAGFLKDPGPIDEDLLFPAMRGKKFYHHGVFENLIPVNVLEKCKEVEPLFDNMLVFSVKDNFIFYSDQIWAKLYPEVIKAKKQAFKIENSCGVAVGILAMPPALKPRIEFSAIEVEATEYEPRDFHSRLHTIKDSCGFYVADWDLAKTLQ